MKHIPSSSSLESTSMSLPEGSGDLGGGSSAGGGGCGTRVNPGIPTPGWSGSGG